jgi:hypothetical protein
MKGAFFRGAALVAAGVALGLGAGAWVWRGKPARPVRDGLAVKVPVTRPGVPPGAVRPAQGLRAAGAKGAGPTGAPAGIDAVAELAAKFRGLKDGEENLVAFADVAVGLAGLTSDDFARLMALLVEGKVNPDFAFLPLMRWASVNPKAALAFALGRKEWKTTERIIAPIMRELARVDLPAAKAALERLEPEERRHSQRAIVSQLVESDPVAALAYARELKDAEAENNVFKAWAKRDPVAAAAALGSADGKGYRPAIESIAGGLLKRDRAAFDSWSAGLSDPAGRAVVRRVELHTDAYTDPRTAAAETAAWLAEVPAAQEAAESLPVHVAQHWWKLKGSPQEVAAWAGSLPAGRAQDAAVGEVGRLWVEQDAVSASAWLGTLAPSPGRDEAVGRLVWKVSKEAPDEAFEWARTIQQGSMRNEMLAQSIAVWAAKDVPGAQAAVATLPPEHRGNLLEMIEKAQAGKK